MEAMIAGLETERAVHSRALCLDTDVILDLLLHKESRAINTAV